MQEFMEDVKKVREAQLLVEADCRTEQTHEKYGLIRDCQDIEDVVSWICK